MGTMPPLLNSERGEKHNQARLLYGPREKRNKAPRAAFDLYALNLVHGAVQENLTYSLARHSVAQASDVSVDATKGAATGTSACRLSGI